MSMQPTIAMPIPPAVVPSRPPEVAALAQGAGKIQELESLRGLAALLVVLFHIPPWNPAFHGIGVFRNGYLMVELFFVLSGYVIYTAYADRIERPRELLRFQFLRFGRLYPVHLVFLLVYLGIEAARYLASGAMHTDAVAFERNSPMALLQQLLLVQAIGPTGNHHSFNSPAWSISVEFYTYLIFGLSLLLARRHKNGLFAALMAGSFVLLATGTTGGFDDLLRCTAGFFLGCLTAWVRPRLGGSLPAHLAVVAFAAIVLFLEFKAPFEQDLYVYALTAILILTVVSSQGGVFKRVLDLPVLTWLGTISYSVYMSHAAVLWVLDNLFRRILKKPTLTVDGSAFPQLSAWENALAVVFAVGIVLTISALAYRYIEQPWRERSRKVVF
jgi:peptidoglycan/LPS O-acetylase OafA/YrhL